MEKFESLEMNNSDKESNRADFYKNSAESEVSWTSPVLEKIQSEGGDDFFQYLSWVGLAEEPNLIGLSSIHHYYYDHNDLRGIKVLINLRKLNQIRHLDSFMHTLCDILPHQSYLVGCFKDNNQNSNDSYFYHQVKFFSGIMYYLDSRPEKAFLVKVSQNFLNIIVLK